MGLIRKEMTKVFELAHFPPPKIPFPGIMTSLPVIPGKYLTK